MGTVDTINSTRSTPILFARQRELLQLLDAVGGNASKLDFQKLLFLYCQELTSDAPYDFVPYRFGAFSFTSYADRRKLIERGFLVDDECGWKITDRGRNAIGRMPEVLFAFARRYRDLRGDELVADAYRRFPFFATRSEIAKRVLKEDYATLAQIESYRKRLPGPALHTIGYEGHTLESYLLALLKSGITILCDVRRNPISRKYGFSKSTLAHGSEGIGIRYEHLPELGIASEQRQALETQADYDTLFDEYEQMWLPKHSAALEKIGGWIDAGNSVALTCYEHHPHQCHRHCVSEAIETRLGNVHRTKHL